MNDKQPKALRLADSLEQVQTSYAHLQEAAAELRRLHEENQRWEEAVAAEREACAQIAFNANTYIEAAAAIRARGQT